MNGHWSIMPRRRSKRRRNAVKSVISGTLYREWIVIAIFRSIARPKIRLRCSWYDRWSHSIPISLFLDSFRYTCYHKIQHIPHEWPFVAFGMNSIKSNHWPVLWTFTVSVCQLIGWMNKNLLKTINAKPRDHWIDDRASVHFRLKIWNLVTW